MLPKQPRFSQPKTNSHSGLGDKINRPNERHSLRKIISISAILLATISLAGCAPASQADLIAKLDPICTPYTEGKALDSIKVSGDLTAMPNATFGGGVTSDKIETKIITEGKGAKLVGNQLITMEFEGLNGGTGKSFQASKHDGTDSIQQYIKKGATPDFCHALTGVRIGSRVAVIFPANEAHGGKGVESLGIGPTDSIVFVLDIISANLPFALGEKGSAQSGFPSVVFDPKTGTPGFTFASTAAPKDLKVEKLIIGNGETIKEGDTVTLNYSGIVYGAEATFDSSWEKGQPAQFELTKGALIEGFYKSLIGAKVGDRIVTMIPPTLGYGSTATGSIPANSSLVFVLDVLGTQHK